MSKKRNKITIFIVAAMMFTSTWAGVFAADPEQPVEETTSVENGIESQGGEGSTTDEGASASENSAKDGVQTKGEDEDIIKAPSVVRNGKSITISWEAVEGATYTITEKSGETETVVYEGGALTCKLDKEVGKYKYKVVATVGENTYESDYSAEVEIVDPPAAVTGLKALSGCYCVELSWDESMDVDGYLVLRYNNDTGALSIRRELPNDSSSMTVSNGRVKWTNTVDVSLLSSYRYEVYAVKQVDGDSFADENIVKSSPKVIADKGCVRPMYITLKLKKKRKLKSLNGGPKITLKKNTVITATGFGGGCYYFTYNGKRYRMARTSAKKQVAHYNGRGNWDYSPEEAELFVKQAGLTSKTNYLIWTSFYTQHMYLMQRQGGTWKCIDHWDCATGKASTPSPTGDKAIGKKKKKHHNIKWWSSFSNPKSIANSIHGKKKGWKLGLPQSHGCIRNEVANAYKVYTMCPKNTKVYNY